MAPTTVAARTVAHQQRDHADHEELNDQRIAAPLQKFHQDAGRFCMTENVAAVFFARSFDLLVREAALGHAKRCNASSTGSPHSSSFCSCSETVVDAAWAAFRKAGLMDFA
jgi:hypothetical protein